MPFLVTQMIVDSSNEVIALDWSYSNDDGSLGGKHVLLEPYGNTPLADVTEAIAVGWLKEQLQNTEEEFTAALAERKAQEQFDDGCCNYTPNPAGPPTRNAEILEGQEETEAVPVVSKKAKK